MISVAYKRVFAKDEITETSILQTLAYFSIFHYPLTRDEIKSFLHPAANSADLDRVLDSMTGDGSIFRIDELYSLQDDRSLAGRRRAGNARAEELLPKARRIGRFLFKFPYVRGIGISGSLSKMYADEKADIDFFIITKANRLWIARTLMHVFKKLTFLAGRQHYYCMNYYVDENALRLMDQNIYTAIETITLVPVSGRHMNDFFHANKWVNEWFSSYDSKADGPSSSPRPILPKRVMEWLFNNRFGDWLDNYLMKITTRRWEKKKLKGMLNHEGNPMDLITGKHFAKSNPAHFQEKVLDLYNKKISAMKFR